MAWRFLRLMMERPSDMEGNCDHTEWAVAGIRQAVVLQLRGLDEALVTSRRKNLRYYEAFHKASGHLFIYAYWHWCSVQAVRPVGGVEVQLHSFSTTALEGGEGSVWHSCWQKYGFISVKKFETFAYVVGLSVPRKFELNFWYMSWSLRVSFHPARVRTEIYTAQDRTLTVVFSSGSTKPPTHPENGNGISPRNIGEPRLDAPVCPRKFYYLLRNLNWSATEK
jgi:hypothetical protein